MIAQEIKNRVNTDIDIKDVTSQIASDIIKEVKEVKEVLDKLNKEKSAEIEEIAKNCQNRSQQLSFYTEQESKKVYEALNLKVGKLKNAFLKLAEQFKTHLQQPHGEDKVDMVIIENINAKLKIMQNDLDVTREELNNQVEEIVLRNRDFQEKQKDGLTEVLTVAQEFQNKLDNLDEYQVIPFYLENQFQERCYIPDDYQKTQQLQNQSQNQNQNQHQEIDINIQKKQIQEKEKIREVEKYSGQPTQTILTKGNQKRPQQKIQEQFRGQYLDYENQKNNKGIDENTYIQYAQLQGLREPKELLDTQSQFREKDVKECGFSRKEIQKMKKFLVLHGSRMNQTESDLKKIVDYLKEVEKVNDENLGLTNLQIVELQKLLEHQTQLQKEIQNQGEGKIKQVENSFQEQILNLKEQIKLLESKQIEDMQNQLKLTQKIESETLKSISEINEKQNEYLENQEKGKNEIKIEVQNQQQFNIEQQKKQDQQLKIIRLQVSNLNEQLGIDDQIEEQEKYQEENQNQILYFDIQEQNQENQKIITKQQNPDNSQNKINIEKNEIINMKDENINQKQTDGELQVNNNKNKKIKNIITLNQDFYDYQQLINKLQLKIDEIDNRDNEQQIQIDELKQEIENKQKSITDNNREINKIRAEIQREQLKIDENCNGIVKIWNEIQNKQVKLDENNNEINKIQIELQNKQENIDQNNKEIDKIHAEFLIKQEKIEEIKKQIDNIVSDMDNKQEKISQNNGDIIKILSQIEIFQQILDKNCVEISKIQIEDQKKQEQINENSENLKKIQTQIEKNQQKIHDIIDKITVFQTEMTNQKEKIGLNGDQIVKIQCQIEANQEKLQKEIGVLFILGKKNEEKFEQFKNVEATKQIDEKLEQFKSVEVQKQIDQKLQEKEKKELILQEQNEQNLKNQVDIKNQEMKELQEQITNLENQIKEIQQKNQNNNALINQDEIIMGNKSFLGNLTQNNSRVDLFSKDRMESQKQLLKEQDVEQAIKENRQDQEIQEILKDELHGDEQDCGYSKLDVSKIKKILAVLKIKQKRMIKEFFKELDEIRNHIVKADDVSEHNQEILQKQLNVLKNEIEDLKEKTSNIVVDMDGSSVKVGSRIISPQEDTVQAIEELINQGQNSNKLQQVINSSKEARDLDINSEQNEHFNDIIQSRNGQNNYIKKIKAYTQMNIGKIKLLEQIVQRISVYLHENERISNQNQDSINTKLKQFEEEINQLQKNGSSLFLSQQTLGQKLNNADAKFQAIQDYVDNSSKVNNENMEILEKDILQIKNTLGNLSQDLSQLENKINI